MSLAIVVALIVYYMMIDSLPIQFNDYNNNSSSHIENGVEKGATVAKITNLGSINQDGTGNRTIK